MRSANKWQGTSEEVAEREGFEPPDGVNHRSKKLAAALANGDLSAF